MAETWILWVLAAVAVFMVIPFVSIAIRYRLLGRKAKQMLEVVEGQTVDADHESIPINYCPTCGPKLSWED